MTKITVNVMMNLTAGQSINGFDVRLNYTNYWTPIQTSGVVQANTTAGFNFDNNIFAGRSPFVSAACIDDQVVYANAICATDDAIIGQVHLAQTIVGASISGPLQAQFLFSVSFNVKGVGSSLFLIDRGHLLNPGDNTGNQSPQFVQDVTGAGIFGNTPVVSFFDYSPQNPPSVLVGDLTALDASASFRSTTGGLMTIAQPVYNWNFGDGTKNVTGTGPLVAHRFASRGNYTVGITVSDMSTGQSSTLNRIVPVSSVLGSIEVIVKNARGGQVSGAVTVKVHNYSLATGPVCANCTADINGAGIAVFRNLSPGLYNISLSGPAVNPASQQATVYAGWTQQAWVYMTDLVVPQPDITGIVILALVTSGGVGLIAVVMVLQSRKRKGLGNNSSQRPRPAGRKPR